MLHGLQAASNVRKAGALLGVLGPAVLHKPYVRAQACTAHRHRKWLSSAVQGTTCLCLPCQQYTAWCQAAVLCLLRCHTVLWLSMPQAVVCHWLIRSHIMVHTYVQLVVQRVLTYQAGVGRQLIVGRHLRAQDGRQLLGHHLRSEGRNRMPLRRLSHLLSAHAWCWQCLVVWGQRQGTACLQSCNGHVHNLRRQSTCQLLTHMHSACSKMQCCNQYTSSTSHVLS